MNARFHPAWAAAAIAFVLALCAAGVRSTPTMLIRPIENEFHWTTATISLAIGVNIALFGLMGPFAAAFFERFGMRRTLCTALLALAIAWTLSAFVREPWQLIVLWGVFVGLGTGSIGLVLGATIVNRWFETHRGTVMGLLTASNATGQLIFLPLYGYLVAWSGWRSVTFTIAGVCAALIPLVLFGLRERPADLGVPPFGAQRLAPYVRMPGNPFANALGALREGTRSRDFWLLSGSFFICGASTNGLIGTHLVPACGDHGISEIHAAGLLAAMGVFDLVGTTASGWLSDRFNSRYLLFAYYGLRGLSLLFLPQAFGLAAVGLPAFAVFYGLDWIATVPPTLKLATDVFGRERAAIMFGWISAAHQLGAGTIAYLAGSIRTATSSYDTAFYIAGGVCMLAAVMVLFIGIRVAPRSVPRPV